MTTTEERRADGIQRVPVEALVEVCGVGAKRTPFEAESADVSGRGIRLRTAYLPEAGAPVVCRFENAGREVLAEGVVAWCQKEARGGEFGVRFTALDARSAEILRDLCGIDQPSSVAEPPTEPAEPNARQHVSPGAKVKLHIEGLGSPMRARVDEGKGGHISVGSSLEFLRLGRKLELESLDDGMRREARIDGLDVMIDPSTGVPRLLVRLKTDDAEDTPQPSVVEAPRRVSSRESQRADSTGTSTRGGNDAPRGSHEPSTDGDPTEEQIDAMVGRVRRIAGATRRKVSEVSIQIGARLGPSMGRAFETVRQLSRRPTDPPRRRTTAAPATAASGAERKLRPQNRVNAAEESAPKPTKLLQSPRLRRVASGAVATGLLATVLLVAFRSPEPSKSASTDPALGTAATAAAAPGSPLQSVASSTQAQIGAAAVSGATGSALVAQVPLFGPTQMATLERAPVPATSAESPAAIAAREQALAKSTQATLASGVDTSKLSEEPTETASNASEEPTVKPEDVAPFGHGKMKDPILYRLKLDAPGEALKGTSSSKGFTITIPGRKLLESPKGFVKRDPRFEKISSSTTTDGVKITWQFKDEAPPFRVRLRKSAVEILISEATKK